MHVPEEAAVAASGLQAGREDQLRGCAPYLWPPAVPTATPTATLTHQQQQQFCVGLDGIQDALQQQLTLLQFCTHLLTRSGLREFGSPGAHHSMFARHRPHSSGSAQFCGICG